MVQVLVKLAVQAVRSGDVGRYPAALPRHLTSIRLKNLELRGKAVNVMISRTPAASCGGSRKTLWAVTDDLSQI
jgi:hypothetical protein